MQRRTDLFRKNTLRRIPKAIRRFAAGFAALLILLAAISPLAVVCAHASYEPKDFTYSVSDERLKKHLENNNLAENYFDMFFYYSFVDASPITVHWDGSEYVFTVPEYTYISEEGSSTYTGHVPAMTFHGPDLRRHEINYGKEENYITEFTGEIEGPITGTWSSPSKEYTTVYEVSNLGFSLLASFHKSPEENAMGTVICDFKEINSSGFVEEEREHWGVDFAIDQSIEGYDWKSRPENSVSEEEVEDESRKKVEKTTVAEKEKGEDGGVTIPAAIAVGSAGAAAAAGAAGLIALDRKKHGKDDEEEAEDASTYRMIVAKNFGDTIKKGADGMIVSARIEEITPASEIIYRSDLTSLIRCYSGDNHLIVEDHGMDPGGIYKNALVSAASESPFSEGQVSFSVMGAGGSFARNVIFKLAGDPFFRFPEDTESGHWILNTGASLDVLRGDGMTYRVRFFLEEATERPEFRFEGDGNFEVDFEDDPNYENTYYAVIKNLTAESADEMLSEKEDASKPLINLNGEEKSGLTLYALFSDGTEISGNIGIGIWEEGLSVKVKDAEIKDGIVIVECVPKEGFYGDDKDPTKYFVYPFFEATVACRDDDKVKIVKPSRSMLTIGKLKTDNYWTKNLLLKFEYEIDYMPSDEGQFWFTQKNALYEGKDPYYAELPLSCNAGGELYEGVIPLRLKGEYLEKMADAQTERHNLLRALRLYIDDNEERTEWFNFFKDRLEDTNVSAKTYRLMRWQIYEMWQANASAETDLWLAFADTFDNWATAADWTKWVAVRAFAMVAKKYAAINYGPLGESLADAFVQPAAEFVLACVEELTDATLNGRVFDIEKTKYWEQISAGGDNLAWNLTADAVKGLIKPEDGMAALSVKQRVTKACTYLGLYFGYTVLRNFLTSMTETGEADLPGAIWNSFKDLTTNAIKSAVGELFGNWMKNCPDFCQGAADYTGEFLQKNFAKQTAEVLGSVVVSEEFVQKWVEEFVGEGITWTFTELENIAKNSWAAGKLSTVTVSRTSVQGTKGLYMIFEFWKCEGEEAVYLQIDLYAGLSAACAGPYAPFTIVCQYLYGYFTGAPEPVTFTAEKPDITQDDVYNFEKLHTQTEQNLFEKIVGQ